MATIAVGQFIANYSLAFVRTYIKQYICMAAIHSSKKGKQIVDETSLHIFKCALEGFLEIKQILISRKGGPLNL